MLLFEVSCRPPLACGCGRFLGAPIFLQSGEVTKHETAALCFLAWDMDDAFTRKQDTSLPVSFKCKSDDTRWVIAAFRILALFTDKFAKFILDMAVFAVECASAVVIGRAWDVV